MHQTGYGKSMWEAKKEVQIQKENMKQRTSNFARASQVAPPKEYKCKICFGWTQQIQNPNPMLTQNVSLSISLPNTEPCSIVYA